MTLIASNGVCADTITQTALITVDPAPTANFVADTLNSCEVPFTVNFTDLTTGGPVSWAWNFGDGNTSTAQNPTKNLGVIDHILYNNGSGAQAVDGGIIELENPLSDHKPAQGWKDDHFACARLHP